jgi:endosialidase-like protein
VPHGQQRGGVELRFDVHHLKSGFKNSISSLDDASGLAEILKLNPVSFHYNDNVGIPGEQVGFIAEQVQQVDPRLVILDASGTPFTVRYEQLTSLLAKAIQQIATITGTFKDALIAWLGSATNGLARVHTHELCTTKSDGTEVCASGDQLAALLAGAGAGAPNAGSSGGAPAGEPTQGDASVDTGGSTTTDTNFLTFNGNNPAEWQLNQPWQDNLGALFTHDGQSETTYSTSTADTTQPGTTAIDYWAQVSNAEWLHTTRAVVVISPTANDNAATASTTPVAANDNPPAPADASTTPAAANDNAPAPTTNATAQ